MKITNELVKGYENTRYYHYNDINETFQNSVWFDELPNTEVTGVLKANRYLNGRLLQTYSEKENHIGVIAATRLGKTTSYVIPTVLSFAKAKNKRSMIISDPKGEIYRQTAKTLQNEGYKVLLLNFREYKNSECWNPLTSIFRRYQKIFEIYNEVTLVKTKNGPRNSYRGKIYENQKELDDDLNGRKNIMLEDVGNDIDNIASMVIPTVSTKDPYWEDSARELLKAYIWGMLEDSRTETLCKDQTPITEDTFSFATILTLMMGLCSSGSDCDDSYFRDRKKDSRAYKIEHATIPDANTTRQCILSVFSTKLGVFRESSMRLITSCNSFEMSQLCGDEPVALFIDYRDELKVHFTVISLFIQNAYTTLIEHANAQTNGKRKIPFYFILDEFGNFPAMKDFETTISASAGRNIFFCLIVQSYAQLSAVYGNDVSKIIRDNLNMHIFLGSNNPETLEEFSKECGQYTRISPRSALNGYGGEIDRYELETIPLIPVSMLSHFENGECIVTEANCGYVMYSKLDRYYLIKEFSDLPLLDEKEYVGGVDPFDLKYVYKPAPKKSPFDF